MKTFFFAFLAIMVLTGVGGFADAAEELTAREIVKRQDDLMRGDTLKGRYVMTVTTPSWQRRLEIDVWSEGRDKTFLRILSPQKEAGTSTLRLDKSMWNYLPKIERTIKIPPSMMLQPWMGSDFANDDLVKESSIVNDYDHTLLGVENIAGASVYKIELLPKPHAAVAWGKIIFWILQEGLAPLREEYYDEHGRLIKTLEFSAIKKMTDRNIPTVWTMRPRNKEGHKTVIEVVNAEYNVPIEESVFSLGNLKRTR